jgi:hypothetical protein
MHSSKSFLLCENDRIFKCPYRGKSQPNYILVMSSLPTRGMALARCYLLFCAFLLEIRGLASQNSIGDAALDDRNMLAAITYWNVMI